MDVKSSVQTQNEAPGQSSPEAAWALVAMSGGVDSSVAALLALGGGLDCAGAFMRLHPGAVNAAHNARAAADHLGIPLHVFDLTDDFERNVVDGFVRSYMEGSTPNPCIACNRHIKFGILQKKAIALGREVLITGHYAQIERDPGGRYLLKKAGDASKDQSYFLYALSQEQLARARFPLGGLAKKHVRELAIEAGLDNARARESQDICFIPDGGHVDFIAGRTGAPMPEGRFVGTDGRFLGTHKGIARYTVGQRRGLGLAMPYPAYVLEIRRSDNTIVVGENERLYSRELAARDINLIAAASLTSPLRACVKIRYRHTEQPATVWQTGPDSLRIVFDSQQRAITRGQAAVIYDGSTVIGGGTIA